MKLKKNAIDEEEEDEEEGENKINAVYPISKKRTRVSASIPRRIIA